MLKISNLSKSFGSLKVLDGIDLTFEKGPLTGLLGPSGGGKTTLLRAIQGLESVDSGTISFEGKTGFMFQDFQLFPHMNVLQNLVYAPSLSGNKEQLIAEAKQLLFKLGLSHKESNYPHELSGGQKQRVALARTLMMKPDYLLMDEPTSGLDMASIDEVIDLLKQVQEMGVTIMIASHDLVFLTKLADRIILLKDGKMALDFCPKKTDNPIAKIIPFYK